MSVNAALPLSLLVVDDDEIDVLTIRRALARCRTATVLHVASHADQALAMLRSFPSEPERLPIVVLDLNLPGMSGLDLLALLRADARMRRAVVVVMTTSRDERDRLRAYELHCAGYFVKPLDPTRFDAFIEAITTYWSASIQP